MKIISKDNIAKHYGIELTKAFQKLPFEKLDVGEGIMVDVANRNSTSVQCVYWGKKLGRKFIMRKTDDGVLVIRVS